MPQMRIICKDSAGHNNTSVGTAGLNNWRPSWHLTDDANGLDE